MDNLNKIKQIIFDLKPYLNLDGGDIEFIKYENNILYVKLTGNCTHCIMQDETLNNGILKMIQDEVPEVTDIININL